jgi:predicted CXXCH cytochrome family protein
MELKRFVNLSYGILVLGLLVSPLAVSADDSACLECHGSTQKVTDAAGAMDLKLGPDRIARLVVVAPTSGNVHGGLGCVNCHPKAGEIPHPSGMLAGNPCIACHDDVASQVNRSAHRDDAGKSDFRAPCWACHTAHNVRPAKDPESAMAPKNVPSRCLECHDKSEYLTGVHGHGVQLAGLDAAATCVSCHGGHDILAPSETGSRVTRRNISFTCGKCHGRVAETYRKSVHGAALMANDNPDVPTCVDCHRAHGTVDPRLSQFRLASPRICARCHANPAMMSKYKISTGVFSSYVADFHGTTAELFRTTSPDQPLNQAVCYDCHGFHDIESIRQVGEQRVKERLLVRCQACHPKAKAQFLSAWTGHYEPTPTKFPIIYWVKQFYVWVIPGTVGFFLFYIAVDIWGRRRVRRRR